MVRLSNRLWIVVFSLAWFFDLLFWKQAIGINFPIFLTLCLLGGFYLLRSSGIPPAAENYWLLVPLAYFGVFAFIRREPLTSFLACIFSIFSLGLLSLSYQRGDWVRYNIRIYLQKIWQLLGSLLFSPWRYAYILHAEPPQPEALKKNQPIWPVLRGILIAIPLLAFFTALLTSADIIFFLKVQAIINRFEMGDILEYIGRMLLVPFYAYFLSGAILHTARQGEDGDPQGVDRPMVRPFLGMTETGIVLASLAILFSIFVGIQFQYFFGGEVNIQVEGYSYSRYARRGFNELLAVAFFNLLMILVFDAITKRQTPSQKRLYSGLCVVIVAQVVIILISSFYRITLANQWHGYSRLRLYPQIFLVWLGLLLVAVVLLEIFRWERYFVFASLLASLGFALTLSLFNVDAVIVHHNVARAVEGRHFNVTHLAMLSSDAVPALVAEFQDGSIPTPIHEGLGAALLCHYYTHTEEQGVTWQSFNISQWTAIRLLDGIFPQLDGYREIGNYYNLRIETPAGIRYLCDE